MANVEIINHGVTPLAEGHIWNSKNKVVYGPIVSRRLRYSLGINFFPVFKVCSFNCAYCDMGKTPPAIISQIEFQKGVISGERIIKEIQKSLVYHGEKKTMIDYITICGNGEATLHPDFVEVAEELLKLRNEILPGKPLAILTNSHSVLNPETVSVIEKFDEKIYKLDAGDEETFERVNRPVFKNVNFPEIVEGLSRLKGIKISTAVVDAPKYSNIPSLEGGYIDVVKRIKPVEIQLHNIDYPVFENDNSIRRLGVEDLIELGYYIYAHTGIQVKIVHSPVSFRELVKEEPVREDRKKNILILDDMEDYLQSLTKALKYDFNVIASTTIEDAKSKLGENISAALIDVRLNQKEINDRGGLEFLKYVKDNFSNIKAVLMTAFSEKALTDEIKVSADKFIAKPMNISQLKEILKELTTGK